MGITYGARFKWTEFGGSSNEIEVTLAPTLAEAQTEARRVAVESGWTPPKWWQWWRWRDYPRE